MTRDPFARETLAMALIGALAVALITTEDDMLRPFAQFQSTTMAAFSNEPRNAREARNEICCTGECGTRPCPAVRHEQPKPPRMTWRERIAAYCQRAIDYFVDPIVRD